MPLVYFSPGLASHCLNSVEGMFSAALSANAALNSRKTTTSEDEGEGTQAVKKRQVSVLSPFASQNN